MLAIVAYAVYIQFTVTNIQKGFTMNRIDKYDGKKIIGWKKAYRSERGKKIFVLIKLEIPPWAERVQSYNKKCRASEAKVLEIITLKTKRVEHKNLKAHVGGKLVASAFSSREYDFIYKRGKTVTPNYPFDGNPDNECRSGIHFFLNKKEAKAYYL